MTEQVPDSVTKTKEETIVIGRLKAFKDACIIIVSPGVIGCLNTVCSEINIYVNH